MIRGGRGVAPGGGQRGERAIQRRERRLSIFGLLPCGFRDEGGDDARAAAARDRGGRLRARLRDVRRRLRQRVFPLPDATREFAEEKLEHLRDFGRHHLRRRLGRRRHRGGTLSLDVVLRGGEPRRARRDDLVEVESHGGGRARGVLFPHLLPSTLTPGVFVESSHEREREDPRGVVAERVGGVAGEFEGEVGGERPSFLGAVVVDVVVHLREVFHQAMHAGLGGVSSDGGDGGDHRGGDRGASIGRGGAEERLEEFAGVRADERAAAEAEPRDESAGAGAGVQADARAEHGPDGGHQLFHHLLVHVRHQHVEGLAHGTRLGVLKSRVFESLGGETNRRGVLLDVVEPRVLHGRERLEQALDHLGDVRANLRAPGLLRHLHHHVHGQRLNLLDGRQQTSLQQKRKHRRDGLARLLGGGVVRVAQTNGEPANGTAQRLPSFPNRLLDVVHHAKTHRPHALEVGLHLDESSTGE